MDLFLGIDAGTTSMKAAIFDLDGHMLGMDLQEYHLETPGPSLVELDAETYWRACCRAVSKVIDKSSIKAGEIVALSISCQGETLIPVDEGGAPTRKAIVWLDNRAVEEARLIGAAFEIEEAYHITGQPEVAPTWPACKILWIRRNEPEVFERTTRFLLLEDYLLYRLTGQLVAEHSLQASSFMLDIRDGVWWEPMLDFVGISADRLGRLIPPGQVVGPIGKDAQRATGLSGKTVAVSGAIDQVMGAVGAGNVAPGVATEMTGGALAILATLDRPLFDPQRRVPCHIHARRDIYCLLPWAQTAGMALRWFRDQFFQLETQVAQDGGLDSYDLMTGAAARVPPGSDGLIVLPHLEGAACPEFNPSARAVFYGATLRHTRAHFVRGILEAVAYMLRKNLDIAQELGILVKEVRSIGGGARSDLWLQIKADVLQKPIKTVKVDEVACLGAAIVAAVATGSFATLVEGCSHMVRLRHTVRPNPDHREVYDQGYAQYLELYERLATMFR